MRNFNFSCEVDLEKSIDLSKGGEGRRVIYGLASTPDYDMESERVLQEGLDIEYFKSYGFFNYDHNKGPEAIIGYPFPEELFVGKTGFHVAGELFKGVKMADDAWNLIEILHKSNAPRNMAFSIQGKVLSEKDGVINKAMVTEVAVTPRPTNPKATLKGIVKSMSKGLDSIQQEGLENFLEGGRQSSNFDVVIPIFKSLIDNKEEWKSELLSKGSLTREEALVYLFLQSPQMKELLNFYQNSEV